MFAKIYKKILTFHFIMKQIMTRRGTLGWFAEKAAGLSLVAFAVKNSLKGRKFPVVDTSLAQISERNPNVDLFLTMHSDHQTSVNNLLREYNDEYLEVYTTVEVGVDMDGNPTTTVSTEYEWEEPPNVPDHTVIEQWKKAQDEMIVNCDGLINSVVDVNNLEAIGIQEEEVGLFSKIAIGTVIYGAEVALILRYEEIAARFSGYSWRPIQERVRMKNTEGQMSRRGFLKMLGIGAGAALAYSQGTSNLSEAEEAKSQLEKEVETLVSSAEVSTDEAFTRYFSISHKQLISSVNSQISDLTDALESGVSARNVRSVMEHTLDTAQIYHDRLNDYFSEEVPSELAAISTGGYLKNEIEDLSFAGKLSAVGKIAVEGLAVGGVIAGTIAALEVGNKIYANKFDF